MKSCPTCNRTFDDTFTFCLVDGSILSAPFDSQRTQVLRDAGRDETAHVPSIEFSQQPTLIDPFPQADGRLLIYVSAGGTCRDPMAKAITKKLMEEKSINYPVRVEARAVRVPSKSEASYAARQTIRKMFGEDLLANHVPTRITSDEIAKANLILVMDHTLLKLLQPEVHPKEKIYTLKKFFLNKDEDVADPWPDGKDKVTLERYAKCGDELKEILEDNIDYLVESLSI